MTRQGLYFRLAYWALFPLIVVFIVLQFAWSAADCSICVVFGRRVTISEDQLAAINERLASVAPRPLDN